LSRQENDVIRRVELTNFKAFERLTVHIRDDAFLVGPNNAGKSTLIAAVKASAHMLRYARHKSPEMSVEDRGR
jgi:predicted ATP-dependent endonuclease of OLD family